MFDKYQRQASETFKEHSSLSAEQSRLLNWAMGLSGETGEVEEVIKHAVWGSEPLDKMQLAKELGDVLWYLTAICTTTDISLSAVAELNINKLAHRYDQVGYDSSNSQARHQKEKEFEDTLVYKNLEAKILKKPAPINIIFLGPDGSGKTTISKWLATKLAGEGFTYHKCDYRQENKPELAMELLENASQVIFDRFYYPDDIIYSRVVHERENPEEPMDWDTPYWKSYNDVRDRLAELNTLMFYVTASPEKLKERATNWADDYVKEEELHKITTLYDRWRKALITWPIIVVEIDTTENTVEHSVQTCLDFVKKAQAVFSGLDASTYLPEEEFTNGGDPE